MAKKKLDFSQARDLTPILQIQDEKTGMIKEKKIGTSLNIEADKARDFRIFTIRNKVTKEQYLYSKVDEILESDVVNAQFLSKTEPSKGTLTKFTLQVSESKHLKMKEWCIKHDIMVRDLLINIIDDALSNSK